MADMRLRSLPFKKLQGERYHLYCMHTLYFQAVVNALKDRCEAITGSRVVIEADCIWIDGRPQAHWLDSHGAKQNVELADLLVDVSVNGRNIRPSRRATLVQAKWTALCNDLGANSCFPGQNDSTNRERDLLEMHVGNIDLYASGSTHTPIPRASPGNSFNVALDVPGQPLLPHASYLLFPQTMNLLGSPYQCVDPGSRVMSTGNCEDYEDLLCRLALPYGTVPSVMPTLVPDVYHRPEWQRLVDGLRSWADSSATSGRNVHRVGQHFPHRSHANFMTGYSGMRYYMHDGNLDFWSGNFDFFGNGEDDDFAGGFWYVQLEINYRDSIIDSLGQSG